MSGDFVKYLRASCSMVRAKCPPRKANCAFCEAADRLEAAEARCEKLEAVAKPFARYARRVDNNPDTQGLSDRTTVVCDPRPSLPALITLGDCRKALAALKARESEEEKQWHHFLFSRNLSPADFCCIFDGSVETLSLGGQMVADMTAEERARKLALMAAEYFERDYIGDFTITVANAIREAIREAEATAYKRGWEDAREKAAEVVDAHSEAVFVDGRSRTKAVGRWGYKIAEAIRALKPEAK